MTETACPLYLIPMVREREIEDIDNKEDIDNDNTEEIDNIED